jgi:hypothetical protein
MPRNRLLAQVDDEMVLAKASLKFWQEQLLLLTDDELLACAKAQVRHREIDIEHLLDAQECLIGAGNA